MNQFLVHADRLSEIIHINMRCGHQAHHARGFTVANPLDVEIGEKLAKHFPLSKMRFLAAAMFAIFGILILLKMSLELDLLISRVIH